MRKTCILLILLVLCLAVFVGCDTTTPSESSTPGNTTTVPANNACEHEVDFVWGTPATCTQPGTTDYGVCNLCGEVIEEREVIPALGHRTNPVAGKEPTCTESGLTDGEVCGYCGEYTTQEVIQALGHEVQDLYYHNDSSHWKTCVRCKFVMVQPQPHELTSHGTCSVCGSACEHPNASWVVLTEATCSQFGVRELHCPDCGRHFRQEHIKELPHTPEDVSAVEATCTTAGNTAGVICSVCSSTIEGYELIPAKGHNLTLDNGYEATCTEPGLTSGETCPCGYNTHEVIPPLGHEERGVYDTNQNSHWMTCIRCDTALTQPEAHVIETYYCIICDYRCAHENTRWEILREPTCVQAGEKKQWCLDCGDLLSHEFPQVPHTPEAIPAVAPTCSSVGYSEGSQCAVCLTVIEWPMHIDPLPHTYDNGCDDRCNICDDPRQKIYPNHVDADSSGTCDECNISVLIDIDLFGINDLHGKFLDSSAQPGVDELTTYLKNAYQSNPNTIIFSSGDMWQGSAESGLTQGMIMTDWMNHLNFAFMTMGNHEFDWGDLAIRTNDALAQFPFLAINIFDKTTHQRLDYCESSVMMDLGDIQIGFIGAIGDCHDSISGEYSGDFYFLVGQELTELVKAESQRLRALGADLIVYSLHDSFSGYDEALSDGYIDLVFEGHSHSSYTFQDSYGVTHIQGGGENSGLAYVEVSYNFVTDSYTVDGRVMENWEYSSGTSDSIVNDLMDKYAEQTQILNSELGRNDEYRGSTYLRQLVAQLYADLAAAYWSDVDVVLGGGYLSCRSPGALEAGMISYGDLYMLFPFDNKIALCTCSGADLLKNYINSANSNYFIAYTDYGAAVKDSIDPDETYYLITDAYNYTYAPNNLTVMAIYDTTTFARDLMARYIQAGGMEVQPEALAADRWYDIGTLLNYISGLPANAATTEQVYTAGVILEISDTTYGQMIIEDFSGQITLYNLYDHESGARYDAMEEPPQVGDVILVYGTLKNYVSGSGNQVLEFARAELIRLPMGDDPTQIATIPQLIALTLAQGPGNESQSRYCFTAEITEIVSTTWGNAYLVDKNGNVFYNYGMYDRNGNRYDAMSYPPQEGDTVTLYGTLKYYIDRDGNVILEMINGQLQ